MLQRFFPLLVSIFIITSCEIRKEDALEDFRTQFEISGGKETATYQQAIDYYIQLAKEFPEVNIQTIGTTDSGLPLHVVTYNSEGDFNYGNIRKEKVVILINSGIHPGESDGIDATMLLFRDLALEEIATPKNTVLVTIPVYNVGGALNRNATSRVNQNGPTYYGFRGNARNYDLNRDFIKVDTKNAATFASIFHLVKPHIFIDNHVSNGADYQYTLTHLFTQHNRLGGEIGSFLHDSLVPALERSLADKDWDIVPYVNVFNSVPEKGFTQFMDSPRYSTGYTTLWNTFGLAVETHMLKPYDQRVKGTYELMHSMIEIAEANETRIKELRKKANSRRRSWDYYPLNWEVDTTRFSKIIFKGFEADTITSEITGFPRLKYDEKRPFSKEINYLDYYIPKDSVKIPKAYIVKKGWTKVMDRMELNDIQFETLDKDSLITVELYSITDYKTIQDPYEGHYPHYNTRVSTTERNVQFYKGDYLIPTDQPGIRYIMETLEPVAVDSFFNWNFFDTVLQQKEGFSPYVFEDIAKDLLTNNAVLRETFNSRKKADPDFANNWYSQLQWIYEHSKYAESAYKQYPIYRLMNHED